MPQALVVIDMQACFLEKRAALAPPLDEAVEIINHVAAAMRKAGHSVIWLRDRETIAVEDRIIRPRSPPFAIGLGSARTRAR